MVSTFNTVVGRAVVDADDGPVRARRTGWAISSITTSSATLFGVNYTRSREDAQNQLGVNDFENAQIRLSDGTLLFQADPFGTGTQVKKANYEMAAVNAGMKYRGWSLDGEYYWRWVDDFKATGPMPLDRMFDHGFQLQGSAMILPEALQGYVSARRSSASTAIRGTSRSV